MSAIATPQAAERDQGRIATDSDIDALTLSLVGDACGIRPREQLLGQCVPRRAAPAATE